LAFCLPFLALSIDGCSVAIALLVTVQRAKKGGVSGRFTFPADEVHAGFCASIYDFHPAFLCTPVMGRASMRFIICFLAVY